MLCRGVTARRLLCCLSMHRPSLVVLTTGALLQSTMVGNTHAAELSPVTQGVVGGHDGRSHAVAPLPMGPGGAEPPPWPVRGWYGNQTLAVDLSALVLLAGLSAVKLDASKSTAGVAWGLGGPIVHLAHQRPGAALGSLAMRATALLLASQSGGIGCKTTCTTVAGTCDEDPYDDYIHTTSTTCSGFRAVLLILLATILDSATLAREPRSAPEAIPRTAVRSRRALTLDSAGLTPVQSGAALSLAGRF
jgi:hypothetical protein